MHSAIRGLLLIGILIIFGRQTLFAQADASQTGEPGATYRISTNLVLVNTVALKAGTAVPDGSLTREDFELFDNDRPVSIKTFDKGNATRPLAVWFIVQCPMSGWEREGSGLFRGQISKFEPILKSPAASDTFGVAHWCDNGASALDLSPTSDVDLALNQIEDVLKGPEVSGTHDRSGELALQAALQKIVDATGSLTPQRVPVVIFLYGDFSAMPKGEADKFVDELLTSSVTVYGLRDERSPQLKSLTWLGGEEASIARYIAQQTGGYYLPVNSSQYASQLSAILTEMHARYELGFAPSVLDGKRHKLRVTLSPTVGKEHRAVRLRYRSGYVAAGNAPH